MYNYFRIYKNIFYLGNFFHQVNKQIFYSNTKLMFIYKRDSFISKQSYYFSTQRDKNDFSLSENSDSLTTTNINIQESLSQNNFKDNQKDILTTKFEKAKDLLNYVNIRFHILKIEDAIQILEICTNFRCYPVELIPKLEKSLTKVIINMNELQLTRTIYGFSMLNYHTKNLNFFYERALTKHIASFSTKNFNTILKSLTRIKYSSIGLLPILRNYINSNLNKFTLSECCDVFCNYIKLIKFEEEEEKILIKKLFDQIFPHYRKLDTARLINFYFLLVSQKSKEISALFEFIQIKIYDDFFVSLIERKDEINHKLSYLLVLSSHFVKKNLENEIKSLTNKNIDFFYDVVYNNFNYFNPDEINTLMTIFINNKDTFRFESEKTISLFNKFIEISEKDMTDMNIDEILLYWQSLLMLELEIKNNSIGIGRDGHPNLKEIFNKFREEILNKRINSFKLNHFASLIEIIHHFKPKGSEELRHYLNSMKMIADKLLKFMDIQTNRDLGNIFDDYYLIGRFLIDLNYIDSSFWEKYYKFLEFFCVLEKESKNEIHQRKIAMLKSHKIKLI